jgi:putative acetyltransferase
MTGSHSVTLRAEGACDAEAIGAVTRAAFAAAPHASGREAEIVALLREAGALALSLVAESEGEIVGHLAASPASVGDDRGWVAIGPVSVAPSCQRRGVGGMLMRGALARLAETLTTGVVLVGDQAWYGRFGFRPFPGLTAAGIPSAYVLAVHFRGPVAEGAVSFHAAFEAR